MNITNNLNIDWGTVEKSLNFAAMDEDGSVWLFSEYPELVDTIGGWRLPSDALRSSICTRGEEPSLKSPVQWQCTLTKRPPNVTNALNIEWDKVDKKFNFAAMHFSGAVVLFEEHPELVDTKEFFGFWRLVSREHFGVLYSHDGKSLLKEYKHWRQTLTKRGVIKNENL